MRDSNGIPMMKLMSDGLIQYYSDELAVWTRALAFYRLESEDYIRRVSAILGEKTSISASTEKEMKSFVDQFTVQLQEFDHLTNQISAQKVKLHTTTMPVAGSSEQVSQKHDSLRGQMLKAERNFMKIKYSCSVFLPSVFV